MNATPTDNRHSDIIVSDAQKVEDYRRFATLLGSDVEKNVTKFDERVRRDYRLSAFEFWFLATLSNCLLLTQIVLGAALTALGASDRPGTKTAIIYLGATSTIIAGLLTYFKSRNQPNRSRQKRSALRNVRNKIDTALAEFQSTNQHLDPDVKARELIKLYDQAIADAEANHPDLWITLGDLKGFLPKFQTSPQAPNNATDTSANNAARLDATVAERDTILRSSSVSPSPPQQPMEKGEKHYGPTWNVKELGNTNQNGTNDTRTASRDGTDHILPDTPPEFSDVPQRPANVQLLPKS